MDTKPSWAYRLLPIVAILIAGVGVLWILQDDSTPAEMLDLRASGPTFESLDELVAASDLVVEARVVGVGLGRVVSDPADPTVGVETRLVDLETNLVLFGTEDGGVIVEQESSLLDGTLITVNGMPHLQVGDAGVFFLVRGHSEEFPYVALVNEQAWAPQVGGLVIPVDLEDPLWGAWNRESTNDLLGAVSAAADRTTR